MRVSNAKGILGMAKSRKYNPKRGQAQSRRGLSLLLMILGGMILIIVVIFIALQPPTNPTTPEVTGTARLKADKPQIDLGNVKLGTTVRASFQLTNIGDQPLRFTKVPYVEIIEGCWPPTPAIGSMVLKPGDKTTVTLVFNMHGDMGGKHNFLLHLPNNDSANPDVTLTVLSNWVP